MAILTELATDERAGRMVLSMIAEPDDPVTGRLLGRLGAVETIRLAEGNTAVPGLSDVDTCVWRERLTSPAVTGALADRFWQAELSGFGGLIPGDRDWPASVDDLTDRAPYVLWTRGASSFLSRRRTDLVTITGARASTAYGNQVSGDLAADLASGDRVVVAGGAYGVEGAAHHAALASGSDTIAVLACGVDHLYPAGHSELLSRIADVGLVVSEMPPGSAPTRHRFLARGRLLAALSEVTVIVEAAPRSGAMAVAREAERLGRQVGAVPGPVTSITSVGPHMLIDEHRARIVTNADQVVSMLDHDDGPSDRAMSVRWTDAFAHEKSPSPGRDSRTL